MMTDSQLLASFARTNSEDAFAELVQRHVHLVHSAALRQVNGDAHLAQDVAQTVFTDLVRKANSLARREVLTGWLYTSAHFAAAKIIRTENRRRDREEKFMREPIHETAPEPDWEKLRPVLDAAMHELKETDREAILLRYFENRQFAEVGAKLGLNENAARMRVERALEKLRGTLTKHGVTTATALASVISANAVQIAPAGLATTLTTASIVSAGVGTLSLFKIMTMTHIKLGISALVVAGAATALVVQHQAQEKLRDENAALQQQIAQLQTDNQSLTNRLASTDEARKLPDKQFNELLKLRGETTVLRQQKTDSTKLQSQLLEMSQAFDVVGNQWINTENAKTDLINAIRSYWEEHDQMLPADFTQLKNYFPTDSPSYFVEKDRFEFMTDKPVKREVSTNGIWGSKIIFRERFTRQKPNDSGNGFHQVKIYGFADGEIFEIHSDWLSFSLHQDFNDFEQQHMVSPPNQ
jgi:RNA polymerase sigma factor (sigma-70 family)